VQEGSPEPGDDEGAVAKGIPLHQVAKPLKIVILSILYPKVGQKPLLSVWRACNKDSERPIVQCG